ncbi:MAG: hypothetical protein AB1635_19605 [Acidobacteriota bacterium]
MDVASYYARPPVRQRLEEYLDPLGRGEGSTAVSVSGVYAGCDPMPQWEGAPALPPEALDWLLARGADVARSMLDRRVFLVHIDLDYQNSSHPDEPFLHPRETFARLEPAYAAVDAVLARFDLPVLRLMTGRGYHFTGAVPLEAPVVDDLAGLSAEDPAWYVTRGQRVYDPRADYSSHVARAYAGLGLVLEHAAHLVARTVPRTALLPLVINGTVVGEVSDRGRECASLDVSFAGDPIDVRSLRCAFSAYQLHRLRPDIFGAEAAARPPLAAVPRAPDAPLDAVLESRSLEAAAALAIDAGARLPMATGGLTRLVDDYRASPLRAFHRSFYTVAPHPPARWADTYDRVDLDAWPQCVAASLRTPNDLLLQPAHLQHVTRAFLDAGWTPRHVAGLVWSRYARDCGWGDRWRRRMDPRTRADYDVRVFAGLIDQGLDRGLDFNCVSAREKGLCPGGACGWDLRAVGRHLRGGYRP